MRSIIKFSLFMFFTFVSMLKTQAQVGAYKFEVKQESYQALTGPSVLYSGYFNNKVSDAIMIPSFKFNGKFYDSLYLCSNGYLSFGPSKPTSNTYYPISQFGFDEGIISGFGNALKGLSGGSSHIAYKQVGNVFVFEWKDVRRYDYNEKINFQIRLNYTDNSISIVYGNMIPKLYNFNTQQIGIRGGNYNDYLNLAIDGNNNWNNPKIGKSNKAYCYFNSDKPTIKPQSGLTYVFTPVAVKKKCVATTNNPFDIKHYPSTNNVWSIAEDGNYIWVGSPGGLLKRHKATGRIVARYDVSNGLPRNRVADIVIDNKGNVWAACERELAMYDGQDWTIYNAGNTQGKLIDAHSLKIDWNGNLWISSYWSGRLVKYDGTNWTVYTSANSGLCNAGILDIEIDPYNKMWIATKNGYTVIDGTTWNCFNTSNTGLADNWVNDILIGNGDTIWFATNGGISYYTGSTWGTYTSSNSGLTTNNINCLEYTPDGNLWVGTWGYGLFMFDRTNWTNYSKYNSNLSDNVINTMVVDAQGDLWSGTYFGLNKVWNNMFINYIQNKEIAGSWVNDIVPDKNGGLWFSTHDGLSRYYQGEWESFRIGLWLDEAEFYNDSILWITAGEYIYNYNINSHTYTRQKPASKQITGILKDTSGNMWITTFGEGVKKYNGSTWTTYNTSGSNIPSDSVTGLDIDQNGNFWFSTEMGVAKFNGTTWTNYNKNAIGVWTNEINAIGVDYNGNIWITPKWSGVVKFDGTNWTKYGKYLGLISDQIDAVYCQKDTNLVWFASYSGISRFDGNSFVNYSDDNGLPEKGVNRVFVQNDRIWLASQTGATRLDYKKADVDFYTNTACYPDKTYLSSISCFTDPSTKYEWDIDNDGNADYFSKNIEHAYSTYGIYPVKLSVINGSQKQTYSKNVTVGLRPAITLTPDNSLNICDGNSQTLTTAITNFNSQFDYVYYWNTGDSVSSIHVTENGIYKVRVGIDECYSAWDSIQLNVITPFDSAEICMVTVDPSSGKNLVIWERENGKGISSYNIYKLFGNSYTAIGNKAFNTLSVFIDQTTDPKVSAARYAITVIDTCGNESSKSPFHQTIHLGASKGATPNTAVLDWTDYIDESNMFQPDWYYIYKGSTPSTLTIHDSLSASFTEWNDTNATGAVYYQISVKKPDLCYPAVVRAQTLSGPFSQSVSNLKDYGQSSTDYLHVNPDYQVVNNASGASATYNVFTNADTFSVASTATWIDISKNEMADFFIITANTDALAERTADIVVTVPGVNPVTVKFVQSYTSDIARQAVSGSLKIYPNPFRNNFSISYNLPIEALVHVSIYNPVGEEIVNLAAEKQQAGKYILYTSDKLRNQPAGIYILRFRVNESLLIRKIVKLN